MISRTPLLFLFLFVIACQNDKTPQKKSRHKENVSFMERQATKKVENKFSSIDVNSENFEMFICIYKLEQIVRVWVREKGSTAEFKNVTQYAFCKISGVLGPKRMENDKQIPEGLYHIDRFNPNSKFHLSLGINYPNASDLVLSDKEKPGDEIFIHGGCVSEGCVSISDSWISELYITSERAKAKGQNDIPVYMFPYAMIDTKYQEFIGKYPQHTDFWANLKLAFDRIQETKKPINFSVDNKGRYILE